MTTTFGDPSYMNNSRSIIRGWIKRQNKYPSEARQTMLEDITGQCGDFSNADVGEEPVHKDYSHIPDSGSNEPY